MIAWVKGYAFFSSDFEDACFHRRPVHIQVKDSIVKIEDDQLDFLHGFLDGCDLFNDSRSNHIMEEEGIYFKPENNPEIPGVVIARGLLE